MLLTCRRVRHRHQAGPDDRRHRDRPVLSLLIVLAVFVRYFRLWIQSVTTGAGIGIFDLLGMKFRKVNPAVIVRSKIMAVQAGIGDEQGVTSKALEAHYLAGGNVPLVIRALIAAAKAKLVELDFKLATAIDLAGRNVLEAVQTSVNPKVIDCPGRGAGKDSLDGVAQNGIQLKVRARVTVRANLRQLIGGATEETIIARVGEGIVSAIGSSQVAPRSAGQARPHLEDRAGPPARRPNRVRDRLDRHRRRGRGREHRRPLAGRSGRGRHARRPGERRGPPRHGRGRGAGNDRPDRAEPAKVLEAEAEVPKAIAHAFQSGKLGLMDYYKLRNIQADTDMRSSIAKAGMTATGRKTSSTG